MSSNRISREDLYYLQHIGVLLAGFAVGTLAAYLLAGIALDFSGSMAEARRLGIVSITTLMGYPKEKDTFNYLLVLILPTVSSVGLWLCWAGQEKRRVLSEYLENKHPEHAGARTGRLLLLAVLVVCCLLAFNVSYLYKVNQNSYTGFWPFLGEEGFTLAGAQSLMSGGVFSRDFSSGYGPMLIYPMVWFMEIFGATVMAQRAYGMLLNLMAYGIIITFLYKTLNRRSSFVLSSLLFIYLYTPFFTVGPNATHLRVALGFVPLLLLYLNSHRQNAALYLIAGSAAGLSLLFSQEVGICSVIALGLFLLLKDLPQGGWRSFVRGGLLAATGCIAVIAPFLLYFASQGALATFLGDMYTYPKLYMLGYSAWPFPGFDLFLSNPLDPNWLVHYWVISVYCLTVMHVLPRLMIGKLCRRNLLKVSLGLFGMLLYRGALCRADVGHVLFSAQPAILLMLLLLDDMTTAASSTITTVKYAGLAFSALLILHLVVLLTSSGITQRTFSYFMAYGLDMEDRWSRPSWNSTADIPRAGGVGFTKEYAATLEIIDGFLKANTRKGDYVYFFPNEAAYYFLFDRKNPTRYAFAYQAVTTEHRREIVRDLEDKKPGYVVYSRATWRLDDIPENTQVPEVLDYLQQRYAAVADYGDVIMLKRVGD